MTLRSRLALLYGLLSSLAIGVALLLAYGFYERAAYRNTDGVLMAFAQIARAGIVEGDSPNPLNFVPNNIPIALRQLRPDGSQETRFPARVPAPPFPVTLGMGVAAHAPWVNLLPLVSNTPQNFLGYGLERYQGMRWRTYNQKLPNGTVLQAALPLGGLDTAIGRIRGNYALYGAMGVLLVAIAGFALSGPALRPVARLTQFAQDVARTRDPQFRLPRTEGRDELGRLGATFNAMLASLEVASESREEALRREHEARLNAEAAADALSISEARLRELNEAQRRFVGDAAHELRAPLTSIRGNLELVRRYPNMSDTERLEAISDAHREAERMSRLIADLLAAARGEASQNFVVEGVRLDAVLTEAWRAARSLSERRRFDLGHLEPARVNGDPDALKQLALTLLENAVKYTPDDGTVNLSLKVVDGSAEMRVSDTGPGIAQEDLERVFDRFYRTDRARSRLNGPGGTGLGLTIAKSIATRHGGSVHLESTLGAGTTAVVRLPLARDR